MQECIMGGQDMWAYYHDWFQGTRCEDVEWSFCSG